jgi:1-acyl-sn-glycerol-3-phosphate acyltransferase
MASNTFRRIAKEAPFHDAGHGFDVFGLRPPYLARVVELARPIYERYFRVDSTGIEQVPARGATILVANHGGLLPIDAAIMCLDVVFRTDPPRIPRAIADHFVPRLPLISTVLARLGVVSGVRANVRCLLERGELIALWPEGVSGPAKPFRDRYRIQAWRVGFAELAIRYGAKIVPVAIIGAEESWPLLTKLGSRAFGVPYVPIPMAPLPLPVRYHIRYGAPIEPPQRAADADDPGVVQRLAADARRAVERLLATGLASRPGVFR